MFIPKMCWMHYICIKTSPHMKIMKHILLLIALIISSFCPAMASSGDIVTDLCPLIGKPVADYVAKTKAMGLKLNIDTKDDGTRILDMTGSWVGSRRCHIVTRVGNSKHERVSHVIAIMPSRHSWRDLQSDYAEAQAALTKAFGAPAEQGDGFDSAEPESDSDKVRELKAGKADFSSIFHNGDIAIVLSITYSEEHGAHVMALYINASLDFGTELLGSD